MVLAFGFTGILAFSVIGIILSFIKSFVKRTYFCAVTEENFFYGNSKTSKIIQYSLNDIEVFEQSNALLLVIKTNSVEKKIILPDPSSNLIQFLVKGY
jgi:hypothetical protein